MTTEQKPIGSGFGASTTAEEALGGRNLSGKTVVVTGGYSGLGLETTRVLANAGATIIVPARRPDEARRQLDGIPRVEIAALDLLDPRSIDAFADAFGESGRPLHILIDSAGVMAPPLTRDSRGYESQFSANHLGHFQLAARLWLSLRRSGGARVVSVSSRGHQFSGVDFEDPNFERRTYDKWLAYGQSKTANVLFAVALDRRGQSENVRAFSVHPGSIVTELARHLTEEDLQKFGLERKPDGTISLENRTGFKTVPQGAATIVWCAANSRLDGMGGVYCEDCDIAELSPAEGQIEKGVRPQAVDSALADRLWQLSEGLTGVSFER